MVTIKSCRLQGIIVNMIEDSNGGFMSPGYQGSINTDPVDDSSTNKHNALAGDDLAPGMESIDPAQDELLKNKIEEKLWAHTEVNVTKVSVYAKNGFVSLTGEVDGPDAKAFVEALVENTDGVTDVVSLLSIHEQNV